MIRKIFLTGLGYLRSRRPRHHSPRQWRRIYINAMVLLLLLGSTSSFLWYYTGDERIRTQVINTLQKVSGGEVELDYASLNFLRQIRIKNLCVYLPNRPHQDENLVFAAHDVILEHNPISLLKKQLRLNRIVAQSARLKIWYDLDRQATNLQLLKIPRITVMSGKKATVVLRHAVIEYHEIVAGKISPALRQGVAGRFYPHQDLRDVYEFELSGDRYNLLRESSLRGSFNFKTRQLITEGKFFLDAADISSLPPRLDSWRRFYQKCLPDGQLLVHSEFSPSTGHKTELTFHNCGLQIPLSQTAQKLPLDNIQAQIVCTDKEIQVRKFTTDIENLFQLQLHGTLKGYSRQVPFDFVFQTRGLHIPSGQWQMFDPNTPQPGSPPENLSLKKRATLTALAQSSSASIRKIIRKYQPTGSMDLQVRIVRDRQSVPASQVSPNSVLYQGKIFCHDVSAQYHKFPYLIHGLRGEVTFDPNEVIVGPLETQESRPDINARAYWRKTGQFALDINAQGVKLDSRLYQALTPPQKQIWNQFTPGGIANIRYRYSAKPPWTPAMNLDVELLNVNARYDNFPIPLSKIKGHFHWDPNYVDFDIRQARAASGDVSVTGAINNIKSSAAQVQYYVHFHDVLLDKNLAANIRGFREYFNEQLDINGRMTGHGKFEFVTDFGLNNRNSQESAIENLSPSSNYQVKFKLHNGNFLYQKYPYPLNNIQAECTLINDQLTISSLQGRHKDSHIEMAGTLRDPNHYNLQITGKPLELTEQLRQAMGKNLSNFWSSLEPEGKINLALHLQRRPERPALDYSAKITSLDCSVHPPQLDYKINHINGTIEANPKSIVLANLKSIDNNTIIELNGHLRQAPSAGNYDLKLKTINLPINNSLKKVLPENMHRHFELHQPAGEIDADLRILRRKAENTEWVIIGRAGLRNGSCDIADNINITLEGQSNYGSRAKELNLKARLLSGEMSLKKRSITKMTANIDYDQAKKQLKFTEITSDFCQGRLAGHVRANFDSGHMGYEMDIKFLDANLAEFLYSDRAKVRKYKNPRGRLNGWITQAKHASSEPRRGSFHFIVQDAVLGELPIFAQLLHVPNLSLPKEGAFNNASFSGHIMGQTTYFNAIHLQGSAVSLSGAGLMTAPENHLKLILVVDPPQWMTNVPVLGDLFRIISPELVQLRVQGPFEKPTVQSAAFPSFGAALKQFEKEKSP